MGCLARPPSLLQSGGGQTQRAWVSGTGRALLSARPEEALEAGCLVPCGRESSAWTMGFRARATSEAEHGDPLHDTS